MGEKSSIEVYLPDHNKKNSLKNIVRVRMIVIPTAVWILPTFEFERKMSTE